MTKYDKLLNFCKNHTKTKYTLRKRDNKKYCYCAEGAMCEVFRRETGYGKWQESFIFPNDFIFLFGERPGACAPSEVWDWFGLSPRSLYEENDNTSDGLVRIIKKIIPKVGDWVILKCYGFVYTVKIDKIEDNIIEGSYRLENSHEMIRGTFIDPKEIIVI